MLDAFINHINTTTALTGLQPIPAGKTDPTCSGGPWRC
jgi:hypothetical protein